MLKVNEIFYSIQGESSLAGFPCVFIRMTGCNLRCTYCDTEYAFYEGKDYSIEEIMNEIFRYNCRLVEITGGEPLLQKDVHELINILCEKQFSVLMETGGNISIQDVNPLVKIIMDLKCPSSGMMHKNLYDNIAFLKTSDEVKFVIGNREDYDWVIKTIVEYSLSKKCQILLSPVFGRIEPVTLVNWILQDNLQVRFQLQLHKYIWKPDRRGV